MEPAYDAATIEARRQHVWQSAGSFRAPHTRDGQPSSYVKANSPFTSGSIHVGHVRSYTIADTYARYRRARGDAVLFSIGFDAFGLPAEQAAVRNDEPTQVWVERCREQMTAQLKRLGFSFDWERTFMTSEEDVYRWSQWLFLRLLAADLIYREMGSVDWCMKCSTTLASMQVEDGRCWRCGELTSVIQQSQWYLRFGVYVEENERALAGLDSWNKASVAAQRGLLGRTAGVELEVQAADGRILTVFTPYPERLHDAQFVMVSPRHPEVAQWLTDAHARKLAQEIRSAGWRREARSASCVPVVDTGCFVDLPDRRSRLPVLVSPAVDGRFGITAILGIPSVDNTDAIIAQRLQLRGDSYSRERGASPAAREAIRYRTHDFSIGRQRSWGTPIPVVHCPSCGVVPCSISELPVRLPPPSSGVNGRLDDPVRPTVRCRLCGQEAHRDTDTLDAHFDGLWIWVPACVPRRDRRTAMFDHPELTRWLPGDNHIFGSDCSTYAFDQRIMAKALRDTDTLAHLSGGEPFRGAIMHGMVTLAGRKMSKHLGNVIDPDDLVSRYGADAVRLAALYAARPVQAFNWSESPIERCHRFLSDLWAYAHVRLNGTGRQPEAAAHPEISSPNDAMRSRLFRDCATAIHRTTEHIEHSEMHKAVRSVMRLFASIRRFEADLSRTGAQTEDIAAIVTALTLLAQLLSPFAPHVGEELWCAAGHDGPAGSVPWPSLEAWPEPAHPARR